MCIRLGAAAQRVSARAGPEKVDDASWSRVRTRRGAGHEPGRLVVVVKPGGQQRASPASSRKRAIPYAPVGSPPRDTSGWASIPGDVPATGSGRAVANLPTCPHPTHPHRKSPRGGRLAAPRLPLGAVELRDREVPAGMRRGSSPRDGLRGRRRELVELLGPETWLLVQLGADG